MPLDYELDSQLKELTEISADHLDWFLQLTKRILFVGEHAEGQTFSRPVGFTAWIEEKEGKENVDVKLMESVTKHYERLTAFSDQLINDHLKFKKPPEYADYDQLSQYFETFMDTLRRIEKELVLDESGVEPITGLRRGHALQKDLDREMQRLARQGKPFSLALVQIDYFDLIVKSEGEEKANEYLKHISNLIKKSLRSFDDAYRTSESEFVLSLKQADVTGGIRALERLKELLERNHYEFSSKKLNEKHVSLSCCVAEPLPHDDVNMLLANMRKDLKAADKTEDAVLEYYELSPLQRYIKSQ